VALKSGVPMTSDAVEADAVGVLGARSGRDHLVAVKEDVLFWAKGERRGARGARASPRDGSIQSLLSMVSGSSLLASSPSSPV